MTWSERFHHVFFPLACLRVDCKMWAEALGQALPLPPPLSTLTRSARCRLQGEEGRRAVHSVQQGPHHRLQEVRTPVHAAALRCVPAEGEAAGTKSVTELRRVRLDRSKVNQYENTSLIKIENVNAKEDVDFYLGKKCAALPTHTQDLRPGPGREKEARLARICAGVKVPADRSPPLGSDVQRVGQQPRRVAHCCAAAVWVGRTSVPCRTATRRHSRALLRPELWKLHPNGRQSGGLVIATWAAAAAWLSARSSAAPPPRPRHRHGRAAVWGRPVMRRQLAGGQGRFCASVPSAGQGGGVVDRVTVRTPLALAACRPQPAARSQGCVHLQGEEGDQGDQVPLDLGEGLPGARQQRPCALQVPQEPAALLDRWPVPHHAVPVAHLSARGAQLGLGAPPSCSSAVVDC